MQKRQRLLKFLVLSVMCALVLLLFPSRTSAEVSGEIKLTKCYNENGLFVMQVETSNLDFGTLEVFLTDEGGDVVDRWENINHTSYGTPAVYQFPRNYADTPSGLYALNIVYTGSGTFGEVSKNWAWTVNHTRKTGITLTKNYKAKASDGAYVHKFVFSQVGGAGQTLHCQIYTKAGKLVRSYATECEYDKGTWTITWNYFPSEGVKMKSGAYIVKYWIEDSNPKQTTLNLSI